MESENSGLRRYLFRNSGGPSPEGAERQRNQEMECDSQNYGRTIQDSGAVRQAVSGKVRVEIFRWFNRLDPKINSEEWSVEDDRKLFKLHDELGNSWVRISKEFKGRTDNSIKNHFYSILRKAIRKINKFISSIENDDSDIRILGTGLVSKIVSAADDKFDKKLFLPSVLIEKAHELKNKLVPYADCSREDQWNNTTKVIKLINDLHTF